jgi:hypothetical protein
MAQSEQIAFLQASIERWRQQGLLDEATFERLRADIDREAPAQARGPEVTIDARPEVMIEARPEIMIEAGTATDAELAAEIAFHLRLDAEVTAAERVEAEARAAAATVPVAERPAQLGQAMAVAAADLWTLLPDDASPPGPAALAAGHALPNTRPDAAIDAPPSPLQRLFAHEAGPAPYSLWTQALRPFLVANAMWLAGALLIVAGSIYFLRLAWDHLSSVALHVVIAGALHGYAAAFFGVGYLLARKRDAHAVGRILFAFACAILPLGSVAAGELGHVSWSVWGAPGLALAAVAIGLCLLVQGFILAVVAGLYERAAMRLMVTTGLGLAFLIMVTRVAGAALEDTAVAIPALLAPLGFIVLARGFLGLPRHRVHLRMSILLFGGAMLWAFLVLVTRAQILAPIPGAYLATLLAALAALLVVTDHRLRTRADQAPRLTEINIGFYVAVLVALVLALAGLGVQGSSDVWTRVNVLACALVATALFAQGAWRYGRTLMTWLAAVAGLFAYFFSPAPFTALLQLAQTWVTSALGYQQEPLPVAFYGLLFLPYLAGLVALALRLRPRRADLARDLEALVLQLSAALVLLAMLGNGDARPVLWTWPIYAVAAFAGARVLARPWLRQAGHVLALAWLSQAVGWLWPDFSPAPVLAAYGAVAALALVRRPAAGHLVFAALAAVVASTALGLTGPLVDLAVHLARPTVANATLTAALIALTMGLLTFVKRAAWYAHAAALVALAASNMASMHGHVSARAALIILLGHAAAYALLAHAMRRAPSADARWKLLARPALVGAGLALTAAWFPALLVHPYTAPLLIAVMFAHLAWLGRGAFVMLLAAVSGALAVVLAAAGLDEARVVDSIWQLALVALGSVYLVLAAYLPPAWPAAERRRWALASVGLIALATGVLHCLLQAMDSTGTAGALSWWWQATAALAVLTAVGAWLWWRRAFWVQLWAGLWPLAFLTTGQVAAVTLAVAMSTGRHPDAAVMALMAPVALVCGRVLHALAQRWRARREVGLMDQTAMLGLAGAGLLAGASVAGCLPAVPGFVAILGLLTLAAVAAVLARDGVHAGTAARIHLALIAVTACYVLARVGTPLAAAGPALDAVVIVVAAVLALWSSLRVPAAARMIVLRKPLQVAALLWPLAAPWIMIELGSSARCVLGMVVAVHYAAMGRLLRERNLVPLAMAFGNAALLLAFGALGWWDALLYALPLALSALVLIHVYAPDLGQKGRNTARVLVLGALYVLALGQALTQTTPLQSLVVVPLLCVAAIAAGTILQVRVYVIMGVLFLAADLGANMLRYGLESRLLGALFLTILGLVIVAGMVYFSVERERIMKRYSGMVGKLRTWD